MAARWSTVQEGGLLLLGGGREFRRSEARLINQAGGSSSSPACWAGLLEVFDLFFSRHMAEPPVTRINRIAVAIDD